MLKKFKLAFIGAGSIGFTRGLLADILSVPEFREIEVAFMDINPDNLDMVYQLCQRDIEENGLNIKIQTTMDRREALKETLNTTSFAHAVHPPPVGVGAVALNLGNLHRCEEWVVFVG